jgi:hypothetical protein
MIKQLSFAFLFFCYCTGSFAQELKYVIKHNDWDADSLGNRRVVLALENTPGNVAKATINWRRADLHPENKELFIVDSTTNKRILNVSIASINQESCTLYFEPVKGDNKYFVYYMPYKVDRKSNYPNAKYLKPQQIANEDWLQSLSNTKVMEEARAECIESINAINSFYPMEVIATEAEVNNLVHQNAGKSYLVFPEDRLHSIRMKHDLPQRWIISGLKNIFSGETKRGENYTYQLGVYPVTKDLTGVKIAFSDLKSKTGGVISSKVMSCLNTNGIDFRGSKFTKQVDVAKGEVQVMWCLVNIPAATISGTYEGYVTVSATNAENTKIGVRIKVNPTLAVNGGVSEPWKQTRLTWLNSTLAQKNNVIKPYIPLVVKNNTIALLGRKVILDKTGFPKNIETYFTPEMIFR